MDVLITGSSGLIGTALRQRLVADGHRPIALVRRPASGADEIHWDIDAGDIDAASIEGVDAVVHLAGAGIAGKRWTDAYRQTILRSRTAGTGLLARTLAGLDRPPSVLASGSAVGYYGSRGDEVLTESAGAGSTFLASVCVQWEAAAQAAIDAGIRTVFLRTGIVQTPDGGALAKQLPLFKLALGGRVGSGRQYVPWITIDDEVGAIVHLLTADVAGPVNLTAPNPVPNAVYTDTLGDVLGRPTVLPVPAFAPRLLLGRDMADALLFESQRVVPAALQTSGYTFAHPELEDGLRAVLGR